MAVLRGRFHRIECFAVNADRAGMPARQGTWNKWGDPLAGGAVYAAKALDGLALLARASWRHEGEVLDASRRARGRQPVTACCGRSGGEKQGVKWL